MDALSLGIAGAPFTAALLVGYSGEALEELFPGTLESLIKPTPCVDKSTLTQRCYDRSTMICGSNIQTGSSQMASPRCVILTMRA